LLTGRAFIPLSVVLASALLLLTGVQVARLSGAARAAGWFAPHEAVTFSGPGLDGAPTTLQASILGAVAAPGAYALPADARSADLVAAAGGLLPTANAAALDGAASLAE